MRAVALGEPRRCSLQHDALRDADAAQCREFLHRKNTGIDVREETGLLENELAGECEILNGGLEPEFAKRVLRRAVSQLRLVAQREQSLPPTAPSPRLPDPPATARREIPRFEFARPFAKD